MKTILPDIALPQLPFSKNVPVFDAHKLKQTALCIGCSFRWIKSPGVCIFQDDIASFTVSTKQSDMLYILTENIYSSYNPFAKCATNRSLSYTQSYLTIRNHEVYHVLTSPIHFQLIAIAYGSESEQEQNVLQAPVQANEANMDCRCVQCHHCADSEKVLVRLQIMLEVVV